jgi:hypothetical protein
VVYKRMPVAGCFELDLSTAAQNEEGNKRRDEPCRQSRGFDTDSNSYQCRMLAD